jgi:hypothetical protein
MIDIFGSALTALRAFNSSVGFGRTTTWVNLITPETHSIPVPSGAKAVEYYVMGGGGSGNSGNPMRGGGGLAFGKFNITPRFTALTAIVAAIGTGAGNSSGLSDGTITKSATGGGSGHPTTVSGGAGSGGDTNRTGGVGGSITTGGCSGGGSPGSPWGDGKNSGVCTSSGGYPASGGAFIFFSSGTATSGASNEAASGGAGQGGASSNAAAGNATAGGGSLGASSGTTAGKGPIGGTLSRGIPLLADAPLILVMGFGSGTTTNSATDSSDGGWVWRHNRSNHRAWRWRIPWWRRSFSKFFD